MTFTSFPFLLFLPAVYLIFHLTPERRRWIILLAASYGYYATFSALYLPVVLILVTLAAYGFGLALGRESDESLRRRWLLAGVLLCLATLGAFKYAWLLESHSYRIFGFHSSLSSSLLSIGISYFTFQAICYLVDIYLEIEAPERHLGHFALYLAFFPKLLQGPIERAGDLLPQLKSLETARLDRFRSGLFLIARGFFKKVVIADRLALFLGPVYADVDDFSGGTLLLATYLYAFQLYFDFSGYTDIARGAARLFNLELTENFDSPYLARSIADFWRRWHISFSRWILDYIFKPLNLKLRNWKERGTAVALLATFLVSGIWHGATWGFLVWGGLHGFYMACSVFYKPYQKKLHHRFGIGNAGWWQIWQVFFTFHLVCFAWIFFRAATLTEACHVVSRILTLSKGALPSAREIDEIARVSYIAFTKELSIAMVSMALIVALPLLGKHIPLYDHFYGKPRLFRFCVYYLIVVCILVLGHYSNLTFSYARF